MKKTITKIERQKNYIKFKKKLIRYIDKVCPLKGMATMRKVPYCFRLHVILTFKCKLFTGKRVAMKILLGRGLMEYPQKADDIATIAIYAIEEIGQAYLNHNWTERMNDLKSKKMI